MKLNNLIKNMMSSILFSLCFIACTFGADGSRDQVEPVTHLNAKAIVEGHLKANPGILDVSEGRDILVFLGNTGAGKSTLINYLSDKKLTANNLGNIILENPQDPSAMVIGEGSNSETFLPRFIQKDDWVFYDFPGFKDTRGVATNLVNACFIKGIIENARSIGFIFVAGVDELTCDRGDSFKKFLNQIKQLVPGKSIENFSALVMTKSYLSQDGLSNFFETNLGLSVENSNPDLAIMRHWLANQKIGQVLRPTSNVVNQQDKVTIVNIIKNMGREKIASLNVDVLYDIKGQLAIEAIYKGEMEDIIGKLISQHFEESTLSSLDQTSLQGKKKYMQEGFNKDIDASLANSSLIRLLRPISENLYQSSLSAINKDLILRTDNIIKSIDCKIIEKERQAAEAARIQAAQRAAALYWQQMQVAQFNDLIILLEMLRY